MEMNGLTFHKVALDTSCFIYLMEGSLYYNTLHSLFGAIELGSLSAVTSTITIAELLTGPAKRKDTRLWEEYRSTLYHFPNLSFRNLDLPIAEKSAQLRALYNLRTPDAIQLATAILEEVNVLITNDQHFARMDFPVLLLSQMSQ